MRKFFRLPRVNQSGQTVVEVLVAIGVASIMLPALATALVASREGQAQQSQRLEATAMLREADEAVRSERELSWTQIATNGTYHPVVSGSAWDLTSGSETVNGYTRQIVISDAQRNGSGAIVTSGGTADPSTKRVVSTVSWTTPFASSVSSEAYYHRWQGNVNVTQTTQATFNLGTRTNTVTTNTAGGEVILSSGTTFSWTPLTNPAAYDAPGNEDSTDVYVSGNYAYLADSNILRIIDITTPTTPTLVGSYTAGGVINGINISGDYIYLATASTTAELTVVNVTNKAAPVTADTLDLTSTSAGTSVYVDSNYAYVTRNLSTTSGANELTIVNVTTPTNITLAGGFNMSAAANNVHVSGNFAYVATAITTAELTIVNVTNKASPTSAGVYNSAGTVAAIDVDLVGTTAYLTENANAGGAEFFILNVTNPASVTLIGTYEANAAVNGVEISGTNAFLGTAITGAQVRILNITTPSAPTVLGSFNLGATATDISDSGNFLFVSTGANTAEMEVVTGTTTASGFAGSGTFESSSIDAGATVGFNNLTFTITEPASTNIQFQIATNTNNSTWNYVGPDGTAGTFYTAPGSIPLTSVAGRYLRYRATLTGPGTSTPTLSDASINYSP
jgi:type II secretory pathway pseudopilin PulG